MNNNIRSLVRSELTRVWIIEGRAGPSSIPKYMGLMKAGSLTWPQGDITLERVPDPERYGKFITVDKIPGEQGVPGLTLTARYQTDLSDLLKIIRKGCDVDIQVHIGKCKDPQDFNGGWEKIVALEAGSPTNYNNANFGALEPSERGAVSEEVPFSGEDLYEIIPIALNEKAAALVTENVVDIALCDAVSCGACGVPSDGCSKIFALTTGGDIIFSKDGGATWEETTITTIGADTPSALACVGKYLVVVSKAGCSLHYALISEILAGAETWAEVTGGFVALKCPNAICSGNPRSTWIVGDGGYIYHTEDPTAPVTVQEAGIASTQNLNAIHAFDSLNAVAVGAANAMLVTRNGGKAWTAVVGPAPAVDLNCVFMRGVDEWLIGTTDGKLFYTRDGGVTWTEKAFPGSGAGTVKDIQFSSPSVGWMAHNTATPSGRILRTIDGGNSWYVAPEGNTSIPTNGGLNALAVCEDDVNLVYAGGTGGAGDGIIIKGS